MRSTTLLACALALVLGCESTPVKPADAGAAKAGDAGKKRDPLTAKLIEGKWAGTLGDEAFELTFADERDSVAARMLFRRFGRSLATEHLKVTLEPPAAVRLKGTRATALVGKGPAPLHEITARVEPDGISLGGTATAAGAAKGVPFTASSKKSIGAFDPTLEPARGEAALVEGKWEGKAGDDPAKLVVTRQGPRLSGKLAYGGNVVTVEPKVQADGVVALASSPHRSGTKLVTVTFEVAFARQDLGEIAGTMKVVTQLGAMMQGQSYPLTLQDKRKKK